MLAQRHQRSWLTRSQQQLDARPWIVSLSNIVAAALFVVGCIGFYSPRLYTASVTAFLCGSVLFLIGALSTALAQHRNHETKVD